MPVLFPPVLVSTLSKIWNTSESACDSFPIFKAKIRGQDFNGDFDMSVLQTCISSRLVPHPFMSEFPVEDFYLEHTYRFFVKNIEIIMEDIEGHLRSAQVLARVVENWQTSPFSNSKHEILFGQDVLYAFKLELFSDPAQGIPRWRSLG
jgi:hypothetical protein